MSLPSSLFKRLKLIDEDEIQRLVEKHLRDYDPTLKGLAQIHREMDTNLTRPDLEPEEKLTLFQNSQQRFTPEQWPTQKKQINYQLDPVREKPNGAPQQDTAVLVQEPIENLPNGFKAKQRRAKNGPLHANIVRDPKADEETQPFNKNWLPVVSKRHGKKLTLLSDLISKHPTVLSNDAQTGEVVVNGRKVQNSSFQDLISDLYFHSKKSNLIGQKQFLEGLSKIMKSDYPHFEPRAFASNTNLIHSLENSLGQVGKGRNVRHIPNFHSPPGSAIKVLYLY